MAGGPKAENIGSDNTWYARLNELIAILRPPYESQLSCSSDSSVSRRKTEASHWGGLDGPVSVSAIESGATDLALDTLRVLRSRTCSAVAAITYSPIPFPKDYASEGL